MLTAGRVGDSARPPERATLIYDASCGFCRRWIDRARRWEGHDTIRFLPLRELEASMLSGRPESALRQAVHLVRPDGAVFAGAAAVRESCRYVRGGWLVLAVASIPGIMPIAERVYGYIARRWGPVSE